MSGRDCSGAIMGENSWNGAKSDRERDIYASIMGAATARKPPRDVVFTGSREAAFNSEGLVPRNEANKRID